MDNEKSLERREALVTAALKEFAAWSYESASLNRIIATAGISKGSFYYHFTNKEELFFYVVDYAVQKRLEYVAAKLQEVETPSVNLDIFEVLKLQAKIGVRFSLEHPELVQFALRVARERGPIADKLLERLGGRTVGILEPLVNHALEKGEIRADIGTPFVHVMLSHLLLSFDQLFVEQGEKPTPEQVFTDLDRYFDFIKFGLAGPTLK